MRSRSVALDAVCVDAFGTLVLLDDPTDRLRVTLAEAGVQRSREAVATAFRTEAAYYRARSYLGRDEASLADLRRTCVQVFLDHLDVELAADEFVPAFLRALHFQLAEGADTVLGILRSAGFSLACVANWDVSLHERLAELGVAGAFHVVLSSAEAGAEKPDPRIFLMALDRLGVQPARALHIGDEDVDRQGALAAGLAFELPPLATLPERLGL